MTLLLAMAGFAEAAVLFSYGIHGAGLAVAGILIILSWKRRGWLSALIALLLLAGVGALLEVLDVFSHVSDPSDPDAQYFDRIWRLLCVAWFALSALGGICLFRGLTGPAKNTRPANATPHS